MTKTRIKTEAFRNAKEDRYKVYFGDSLSGFSELLVFGIFPRYLGYIPLENHRKTIGKP